MCLWTARCGSLADAGSQLPVHDAHNCRLITSDGRAEIDRGRNFNKPNPTCVEQRDDLVQAVLRRVGCNNCEDYFVRLRRFPHLIHTDNNTATPHAEPQQTKETVVFH